MKAIEIISALENIAQRFKLSKDFPVSKRNLMFMLNTAREKQIREYYDRGDPINPTWVQRLGILPVTLVTQTDDPTLPAACKQVGKIDVPVVITLEGDKGFFRVSKPDNSTQYYPIDMNRFYEMDSSVEQFHENWFWREEAGALKIHPYTQYLQVFAILNDPLQAVVIETTYVESGNLIYADDYHLAETYEVFEGLVTHDEIEYEIGDTFTAVSPNFTGPGKVKLKNRKRKMTLNDTYPIDGNLLKTVIQRIMVEDFGLSKQQAVDITNDAQTQFKTPQQDASFPN